MVRVYVGAVLIIAGIAGFIEVHSHPYVRAIPPSSEDERAVSALQALDAGERTPAAPIHGVPAHGLSPTAHDLLLIGAWALIILGVVTVVLGFVRGRATA